MGGLELESMYNAYLEEMRIKSNHTVFYPVLKRCIDVFGAIVGLILLAPLFIAVSIAIKWEDPKGSVFLHKSELEKMAVCLSFISSGQWSTMRKNFLKA